METNQNQNTNELLLLGLLRHQAMHGYRLMEVIQRAMGQCVDLKKPTAYFLLERMTKAGWIEYEEQQSGTRPVKRVYRITPAGEDAYQRMLRDSLTEFHPLHTGGDVALAFSADLPAEEAKARLEEQKHQVLERLHEVEAAPSHPGRMQWMLEHQIRLLREELEWLEEVSTRIQNEVIYHSSN
jgi:DNA-binding PadR family transcriptional regulator